MEDLERRYNEARQTIQEWMDKQGHDRCWYYPDLFKRLAQIFDAKILDKPRTSVRGESWTSKNPDKLRTSVRSKTQGFFDITHSRTSNLPPLEEFKRGCERYQNEEYKSKK